MRSRSTSLLRWGLVGLALLSFASRMHALLTLPAFVDEGNHLRWAAEIWRGSVLFPFSTSKGLTLYYFAAFLPFGSALWLGRAAVALSAPLTLAGIWALSRSRARPKVGLIAAGIYTFMPWTFFHDRLAISDPLVTAAGILFVWAVSEWSHRTCRARAAGAVIALTATILFKLSGAVLLVLAPLVVFIHQPREERLRKLLQLSLPLGLALLAAAAALGLASLRYSISGEFLDRAVSDTADWLPRIRSNLRDLVVWSRAYLGASAFFVAAGALLAIGLRDRLAQLALAGGLLAGGLFVVTAAGAFPRYYQIALPFAATLAAIAIVELLRCVPFALRPVLGIAIGAWLVSNGVAFGAAAYRDPSALPLPAIDQRQYISDWSAGYGIRAATLFAAREVEAAPAPAIIYAQDLATWSIMRMYWPATANGAIYELWEATAPGVIETVAAGEPAYLVVDAARFAANFEGLQINPHELERFPRPRASAPVIVYRLAAEPFQFPPP